MSANRMVTFVKLSTKFRPSTTCGSVFRGSMDCAAGTERCERLRPAARAVLVELKLQATTLHDSALR